MGTHAVVEARYVNYFKVGHNEHEFIFDFGQFHSGVVSDPADAAGVPIARIVMGPSFAKVLLDMLSTSIARYEQEYGSVPEV